MLVCFVSSGYTERCRKTLFFYFEIEEIFMKLRGSVGREIIGIKSRFLLHIMAFLTIFGMFSCQTKRDQEREERLFAMQTRLLYLENKFSKGNQAAAKSGENLSMGLAESQVHQEKTGIELQALKGELQTLRHFIGLDGLKADEISSQALGNRLLSIEKKLTQLDEYDEKIQRLEETQNEILKHLETFVKKEKSPSNSSVKKRSKIKSLAQAQKAFDEKRYLHVVDDLPSFRARVNRSEKFNLDYLYAQSLFKLGRISESAIAFDDLIKEKNTGKKAPKIYLRLGDCFRLLGDKNTALIYYEELIYKFPKSSDAKTAQSYLAQLKAKKI